MKLCEKHKEEIKMEKILIKNLACCKNRKLRKIKRKLKKLYPEYKKLNITKTPSFNALVVGRSSGFNNDKIHLWTSSIVVTGFNNEGSMITYKAKNIKIQIWDKILTIEEIGEESRLGE